jgi:hypothetical protein
MYNVDGQHEHFQFYSTLSITQNTSFQVELLILNLTISVRVTLRLTVSQSVRLGVEPTLRTFDQMLLPFQEFGSSICCPVSVGRPL